MWYNGGPNQYSDTGMFFKILQIMPALLINRLFLGRYIDILITHAPPRSIHDKPDRAHTGFKALRWFMRIFKPRYLIHGHVHLWNRAEERRSRYYNTEVVNAYDHCIIEMESKK
jgi:Icc-related predicted phosphoesterase